MDIRKKTHTKYIEELFLILFFFLSFKKKRQLAVYISDELALLFSYIF